MKAIIFVSAVAIAGLVACGGAVPVVSSLSGNTQVQLVNPSFDLSGAGSLEGWEANEHNAGNSFSFVPDTQNPLSTPASARINRYGNESWGLFRQTIPVKAIWIGKTARLTGSLRSEGADSFGGALFLQTRSGSDDVLTFNHMNDRRLYGSKPWASYSVDIKIPPQATQFNVGVMLEGGGTLWADDLKLEIID